MWNWVAQLEEMRQSGHPVACVTVIQCTGSTPREIGAKMLVRRDGQFFGTIGGGHLEQLAIEDARQALNEGVAKNIRYPLGAKTGQCCGGIVDLLFEVVNTGPRLYLFGAGHVGQAVCRTLSGTPFTVHVIDERKEWIQSPLLPMDTVRHAEEWDDFVDSATWDPHLTYVAIMTFRHDLDERILERILRKGLETRYLGLIGSFAKWERFKQRLRARKISDQYLARVRSPIGLEIGGKAPQEVAISLSAELLKLHYGR